ncbi:MAG: pentapeptide repeat-containing protein [Burkholderiales bacterium]|nr:pentapeptide repeat-containing protein [Burkholderiales bacterium]
MNPTTRRITAATLALVAALAAGPAVGCSCVPRSPQQWLEGSHLIFLGTVESVDFTGKPGQPSASGRARFRVHQLYKGELDGDTVEVRFSAGPGASCGTSFVVGTTEPIFASLWRHADGEEAFGTGLCSRVLAFGAATNVQPALDAYRVSVKRASGAAQADPSSVIKWNDLAVLQEAHKDFLGVVPTLRRLNALAPTDSQYLRRQGDALLALGRLTQAVEAYDRALSVDDADVPARRGRDQAMIKLGRASEVDTARRDFSAMTIQRADYSARDLAGATFARARLNSVRFNSAKLAGADFSGADLHAVDFSDADLQGANLAGLRSYLANFSGSDLRRADFSKSNLFHARLDGADLRGANLAGASFERASLRGVRLDGAKLDGINLYGADLTDTDLSGANLVGRSLQGIALRNSRLVGADLREAFLAGPVAAARANESLHGPGRPADLRGTDLTDARLDRADLRFALFDCKTRWPAGFDPTQFLLMPVTSAECPGPPLATKLFARPGELREMPGLIGGERARARGPELEKLNLAAIDLSGANLSGFRMWSLDLENAALRAADLRHADLAGSNLRGSDLTGADLSGARLGGADFTATKLEGAKLGGARYDDKTRWPAGFVPQDAGAILDAPRPVPPSPRPVP